MSTKRLWLGKIDYQNPHQLLALRLYCHSEENEEWARKGANSVGGQFLGLNPPWTDVSFGVPSLNSTVTILSIEIFVW